MEHKKSRPLATLITDLQQAVLAEWDKLRGSLDVQPGASASSAAQSAGPPLVSEAASNSEQPAITRTAAQSRVKRSLEIASAAQPGRRAKARRQEGASSASASATLTEALHPRDDVPGVARLPVHFQEEETSAAQIGRKTKQRRLTAMFLAADSQQAGATASSSSASLGINTSNTSAAQPGQPTKQQRLTAIFGSDVTRTSVAQSGT